MTTIAYKDGIMACDSHWTDCNGLRSVDKIKIIRLPSGALLGGAGDSDDRAIIALLKNIKTADDLPSRQALAETHVDYHGLLVFPSGDVWEVGAEYNKDHNGWEGWTSPNNLGGASVGSGSSVAIGAMDAGKDAREAVEIACRRDPYTKGPVHEVPLVDPNRGVRAKPRRS